MPSPPTAANPAPRRGLLAWTIGAITVIALTVLAIWYWPQWDRDAFLAWKREAGPVPFFIALALLPAIGFPTSPFYVLAGATFSPLENVIGITTSLAVNLALCYALARSALRPAVEWLLRRTPWDLPQLRPDRALRFVLLVKMTPGVGTFLKNYIIAFAGVSFPLYFVVCFIVTATYATAFVLLGDSLAERDLNRGMLAVGVFGVVGVLLYWLRRRLARNAAARLAPPKTP